MAKTRAQRKARNRQRDIDRARAAAELQRRISAAVDAAFARMDAHAALDALLARCDGCGREQVAPGPHADWLEPWEQFYGCVVCGTMTGAFVAWHPGNPVAEYASRHG